MKVKFVLLSILLAQVFAQSATKVDLLINDKVVIKDGTLVDSRGYICVENGTQANSPLLGECAMIDLKCCFPHVFISGIYSRINPFNQIFYYRIHSPIGSGYTDNLQIKYVFKGVKAIEAEEIYKNLYTSIMDNKASYKRLSDKIWEFTNKYNSLTSKLSTGGKSISEIQADITMYKGKISSIQEKAVNEQINFNKLKAIYEELKSKHVDVLAHINGLNDKAENLDNTINNNLISIGTFENSLLNNSKAIKETEERIAEAKKKWQAATELLKQRMPNNVAKVDSIIKSITERKLENVVQEVDSIINFA